MVDTFTGRCVKRDEVSEWLVGDIDITGGKSGVFVMTRDGWKKSYTLSSHYQSYCEKQPFGGTRSKYAAALKGRKFDFTALTSHISPMLEPPEKFAKGARETYYGGEEEYNILNEGVSPVATDPNVNNPAYGIF